MGECMTDCTYVLLYIPDIVVMVPTLTPCCSYLLYWSTKHWVRFLNSAIDASVHHLTRLPFLSYCWPRTHPCSHTHTRTRIRTRTHTFAHQWVTILHYPHINIKGFGCCKNSQLIYALLDYAWKSSWGQDQEHYPSSCLTACTCSLSCTYHYYYAKCEQTDKQTHTNKLYM